MAEVPNENESSARPFRSAANSESPPTVLSDAEMLLELALCPHLLSSVYNTREQRQAPMELLLRWKRLDVQSQAALQAQISSASEEGHLTAESQPQSQVTTSGEDAEEAKHFYTCVECGKQVDKRQLDDVLFHEDHKHRPDIPYSGSERIS